MKETLEEITAPAISRFGREWKLVLEDFGVLQQSIDMPQQFKVLIGLADIMRWCNTPVGIDKCLTAASKRCNNAISKQDLDCMSVSSKEELIGELIDMFLGDSKTPEGENGEPRDPLPD